MALKSISTVKLRRELARRERGASKLSRQRDVLAKRLAALERDLSDLGIDGTKPERRASRTAKRGPGRPKGKRARAKNEQSLSEALAAAVRVGSIVSPVDAAKRVQESGYRSASKTFGIQVAGTLAKHKKFKQKGRGQYERVG